jgi:hypothetical protein
MRTNDSIHLVQQRTRDSAVYAGPPKVMTVFQTAVLVRRSNFYRKCKVEMKEHMLEIVHKLCPENHLW